MSVYEFIKTYIYICQNIKITYQISETITDDFDFYMFSTFLMTMYYFYTYRIVIFKVYTLHHINSMSWDLL